jgi:hypothetical protein
MKKVTLRESEVNYKQRSKEAIKTEKTNLVRR